MQDLYGNMPVRVKQRAVQYAASVGVGAKEMDILKRHILALLLAWPSQVSLTLTDMAQSKREFLIRVKDGSQSSLDTTQKSLRSSQGVTVQRLDLRWICSLLSQGGYIEPTECDSWQETSANSKSIRINAALCVTPAPSKRVQFISLGIRPIAAESEPNILLDEINKLYSASSFGNLEEYDGEKKAQSANDRRFKHDGLTNRDLRGAGKGVDRWPMFFMRIEFRDLGPDPKLEREGIILKVLAVIKAMVLKFLESNGFRPVARSDQRRQKLNQRPSLAKTISSAPDCFSAWSRIKSSQPFRGTLKSAVDENMTIALAENPERPSVLALTDVEPKNQQLERGVDNEDGLIKWVDPVTKRKVMVNSRTGLAVEKAQGRPRTAPPVLQKGTIFTQDPPALQSNTLQTRPSTSSWAHTLISNWENPVFAPVEQAITRIHNETNDGALPLGNHHNCDTHGLPHGFSAPTKSDSRIPKTALQTARVISQVDQKFVLIRTSARQPTLILIDQHAADERIRVEGLLHDLRTQGPATLSKPLTFSIATIHEHTLLSQQIHFFAQWRITYNLSSPTSPASITVTALPPAISQRCVLQPSILLNLLRSTIHSSAPLSNTTPPKALLDIINSRACRSAIMFNDELSREECVELVRRLARTGNPFQCAHGRVSMVPLVGLGEEAALCAGIGAEGLVKVKAGEGEGENFVEAWKRRHSGEAGMERSGLDVHEVI